MRSQEDATRQKHPSDHGPTPGNVDPLLARILHNQRAQRKSKRNRESNVAQVEHGRMDDHFRILKQRVQAVTVWRQRALHNGKRVRGKIEQQQKKNLNCGDDHGCISK